MLQNQGLAGSYSNHVELGASAARTAYQQAQKGDTPDVVFGSINWGETLYLKEVWPQARHLGYAEFLYDTKGRDTGFDPEFSHTNLNKVGVCPCACINVSPYFTHGVLLFRSVQLDYRNRSIKRENYWAKIDSLHRTTSLAKEITAVNL